MPMKRTKKWIGALLCLLLLLSVSSAAGFTARAASNNAAGDKTSLSVYFGTGHTGFPNTKFKIYRVGELQSGTNFELTGDFAAYPVSLSGLDSAGWRAAAQTLATYAVRDMLTPLAQNKTGKDGRVLFSGLSKGLYLVSGSRYQKGNNTYIPEPFLINLPMVDEETGTYLDTVSVDCKYEMRHEPGGGGGDGGGGGGHETSRRVLKIWHDAGFEAERPKKISVQLLRDGEVYDTVQLSAANDWRYSWSGLDTAYQWQVAEKDTPAGYTVLVDLQGITFTVNNTKTPEPEQPKNPNEQNPPTESESEPPVKVATPSVPQGTKPRLPQTGMLWWPVPFLAIGGMVLFLIGWEKQRHEK